MHDFACALGAYYLTREPEYFKSTLFVIDQFHAEGHKTCSHACFLRGYMADNTAIANVNSSAAESGNSGLGRIRPALSHELFCLHITS